MLKQPQLRFLILCVAAFAFISPQQCKSQEEDDSGNFQLEWAMEQVLPEQGFAQPGERRLLQSGILLVKGVPPRFTIRPIIDTSLCVHRALLEAATVSAAREQSGLPPITTHDILEYGRTRLVLMPCVQARNDVFLAESILGRTYQNSGFSFRGGFLKPPSDTSVCLYGVNASYTAGHPVFGVTGTEWYEQHNDSANAAGAVTDAAALYAETELDWFDDYAFDFGPYTRYGYDPATMVTSGTFRSPNPLPVTMLDASGWGPFHTSWGPCMKNPFVDSATPSFEPASEVELRYQSYFFIDSTDTQSIAHLPAKTRRNAFALLTLGPERPQPDMSPNAGLEDAGVMSHELGGTDRPYGNGYSKLVSNELCLTVEAVRAGAQVRLAPCDPMNPAINQVFQLALVNRAKRQQAKKNASR